MKNNTMGLFYNENFDTLFGYLQVINNPTPITHDNLVFFHNEKQQLVGFNILNAKTMLKNKLTRGINSDNKDLIVEIITLFHQYGYDLTDINSTIQFIVGEVVTVKKHPNSDKLNICEVNLGVEQRQIICGATNVDHHQRVVVANIGAWMPNLLQIVPSELRGEKSDGMICSERELGLPITQAGKVIMVLTDNKYQIGDSFWKEYYKDE
ncbi:YtpR family tRNA-binding protein [Spiroplasma sp. DGKH1]|uniref:YtpR family tRNA-binding protein n=1 Tax=Spiroplasma sp. DGKH1 TaxID=3050074 RepID=UPI0034C5CBAC